MVARTQVLGAFWLIVWVPNLSNCRERHGRDRPGNSLVVFQQIYRGS
ncbi:hypothetical protein BN2476_630014 [Paraburkholderia piptadeniae]|uniref:Uncharacterized protein n=1 Tax=Paraburkholderia piptadeniae TaxID=1701573 RepID=A0A1N7SL66_9BURK|nr:hypothetical protein BN2476_630014 [Paraburkholderia piptadeniae]